MGDYELWPMAVAKCLAYRWCSLCFLFFLPAPHCLLCFWLFLYLLIFSVYLGHAECSCSPQLGWLTHKLCIISCTFFSQGHWYTTGNICHNTGPSWTQLACALRSKLLILTIVSLFNIQGRSLPTHVPYPLIWFCCPCRLGSCWWHCINRPTPCKLYPLPSTLINVGSSCLTTFKLLFKLLFCVYESWFINLS